MVVPLPGPGEAKLTRLDAAEVTAAARGISPFQSRTGPAMAAEDEWEYPSYGASPD
jgi:hypothetical protein